MGLDMKRSRCCHAVLAVEKPSLRPVAGFLACYVNLRSQRPGFRSHIRGWALVSDGTPQTAAGGGFHEQTATASVDIISSGIEVKHKLYVLGY